MERRTFLGAAGVNLTRAAASPNDRVALAVIGVRGQGRALAGRFSALGDADVRYLCDVDERVFDRAAAAVEKASGRRPEFVRDLREILDNPSVDAVAIATPDHWHAPAAILACDAGKDVYVEKPASHNLREGRLMVDAARRNNRIVQLGIQSRSRPSTLEAIKLIRAGRIGQPLMAKAWDVQLRDDIGHCRSSSPPPEVDYDTWTGPAHLLPFSENRFHYKWHWHWNYGTGDMGNDGVHQLDIARWALGAGSPRRVSGMGRKLFFKDDQQTPDTMNLTFDFGDTAIQFEMRIWNPYGMNEQSNGVAVYGTEGMIHIGRWPRQWGYRLYDRAGKLLEDTSKTSADPGNSHQRNFIDCVRSRKQPNADIETGHRSSSLCHLGNIVAKTGRNLNFDGVAERVSDDQEAGKLLTRRYRSHWSVPRGV